MEKERQRESMYGFSCARFFPRLRRRNARSVSRLKAGIRRQAKYEECTFPARGARRDWRKKRIEAARYVGEPNRAGRVLEAERRSILFLSLLLLLHAPFAYALLSSPRGEEDTWTARLRVRDRYAASLQLWSRRQVILNAASTGRTRSVMSFPMLNTFIVWIFSTARPLAVRRIVFNNEREKKPGLQYFWFSRKSRVSCSAKKHRS